MLTDLLYPATDQGVFVQWAVAALFWAGVLLAARRIDRELRLFLWGLAVMNAAWFAVRALH